MIDTIFVEHEIYKSAQAQAIILRYKNARIHIIECYTEIFNQKKQSFRAQKNNPKLILAKKKGRLIQKVPALFNLHRPNNYYFSHLLNCPFDCQYCYLQAQFQSAHYVYFVNTNDFFKSIAHVIQKHPKAGTTIFTGYDCDSLALNGITNFYENYYPLFKQEADTEFEIRTKSQNIQPLLDHQPLKNVIIAYSLNPQKVIQSIEKKTASLDKRLAALEQLERLGYSIAIRLDPIIDYNTAEQDYSELINTIFSRLKTIHSITLGPYRLANNAQKIMRKKSPQNKLIMCEQKPEILNFVKTRLLEHMDTENLFLCY
tara:strand:- start:4932 stop:5876 length:945 start_codon:yes stop_codon:yes gene_type:complete